MSEPKKYIGIKEAAEKYKIKTRALYFAISRGAVRAVKRKGRVFLDPNEETLIAYAKTLKRRATTSERKPYRENPFVNEKGEIISFYEWMKFDAPRAIMLDYNKGVIK